MKFLVLFLVAFCTTYLATPFIRQLALKWGVLDKPSARKIHKGVIPRLGGLALFLGFVLGIFVALFLFSGEIDARLVIGITFAGFIVMCSGIIDDIWGIKPFIKILWQLAGIAIIFSLGIGIDFISNPFDGLFWLGWFSLPITALWIIGLTNAVNLADGLDGLASGIAAIASFILFLVAIWHTFQLETAVLSILLAAVCLAFLRYNFNPASIFLGDTGALFIGFEIAVLSIIGVFKSALLMAFVVPVLILGFPIFDTGFAIFRRLLKRQPIFSADKEHIHHNLMDLGFSQKKAVLSIYIVCLVLGLGALLISSLPSSSGGFVFLGFLFAAVVAVSFIKWQIGERKNGSS